jgi:hypothetical protein
MAEARRAARSRRPRRERRTAPEAAGSLQETWRRLNFEQRVATVAALLLIVSTFGPFSFVEAAIVLTAAGVLALVKKRADRREFHLPFGDGTVILTAGMWSALLILARVFDRPLGQSVLALTCAAILTGAGARERAKRPADDLPPPRNPEGRPGREPRPPVPSGPAARREPEPTVPLGPDEAPTERLTARDAPTEDRRAPRARRPPPDDVDAPPRPAERP